MLSQIALTADGCIYLRKGLKAKTRRGFTSRFGHRSCRCPSPAEGPKRPFPFDSVEDRARQVQQPPPLLACDLFEHPALFHQANGQPGRQRSMFRRQSFKVFRIPLTGGPKLRAFSRSLFHLGLTWKDVSPGDTFHIFV